MRNIIVIALLLATMKLGAQVQTNKVSVAPKASTSQTQPYDSTRNMPSHLDLNTYVGQLVYFPGIEDHNSGYHLYNPRSGGSSFSLGHGNLNSTAFKDLYGKYFIILCNNSSSVSSFSSSTSFGNKFLDFKYNNVDAIIRNEDPIFRLTNPNIIVFKNRDDENEIVQYYLPLLFDQKTEWITVSYYNYIRSLIGQKFYLLEKEFKRIDEHYDDYYCLYPYDINTGESITFNGNDLWEFIDVCEKEDDLTLIAVFKNSAGQTTYSTLFDFGKTKKESYKLLPQAEYNRLANKYGSKYTRLMLKGEYEIGMPEEIFRLLLGAPSSINRSSSGDQWVYSSRYFYFKNGKLTAWN